MNAVEDAGRLEAVRGRLAGLPYLKAEIAQRGKMFVRNGKDRPAPWPGFTDGSGLMLQLVVRPVLD